MILTKQQQEQFITDITSRLDMLFDLTDNQVLITKIKKDIALLQEVQDNIIEDFDKTIVSIDTLHSTFDDNTTNFSSVTDAIVRRLDDTSILMTTITTRLGEIEHALNIKNQAKNSKNPWAEITASDYDQKTGQIRTTIDWNEAFIQSLISYGFVGKDDNEIISLWLTSLYHNFKGSNQP